MVLPLPEFFDDKPGSAINAPPFEGEAYLDFTGPPGSMSDLVYGLVIQLGKWGFARVKMEEWVEVSPAFKQYYDITIQQKQALETQIKSGLAQIANAIHDYELVFHDLRKYREFLEHFTKIGKGKELEKSNKEEGGNLMREGEQSLKAIFIDEVDVHTGEGIALKLIAPRWPTIIADFMRLADDDTDPDKIAKKLNVSGAEGVVLATKNKLYVEWRDKLFGPTVKERYQNILRLVEARRASIDEYTNMLKPAIARFKIMADALESKGNRVSTLTSPLFRPGVQAYSLDYSRICAWRPFSPSEKYKMTREILDEIPASKAGFSRKTIQVLKERLNKKSKTRNLTVEEDLFLKKGIVYALPEEPSIDNVVIEYAEKVAKEYGVKIDMLDVFEARRQLTESFSRRAAESAETGFHGAATASGRGVEAGSAWIFSPYFVFLDVPIYRLVIKLQNGEEKENIWVENLRTSTRTQNVIIINTLEALAREKQLENYIGKMLGEVGGVDSKTIEELAKGEYPEIFGKPEPLSELEPRKNISLIKKILGPFADLLHSFGITTELIDVLRARYGPYEFALDDRITEIIQPEPGSLFQTIRGYIQQGAGVPGAKW